MALAILDITDALVSHAGRTGRFSSVNAHEPLNAPGTGIACAVWPENIVPVRSSGLDSTTVRLLANVRLYSSAESEPLDAIDPDLISAADELCAAYVGDFTLDGLVRQVDVRGIHGQPLEIRAGYIAQDGLTLRVLTITVPLIVNDLWEEMP